jgi:hypothetical protein
MSNWIKVENNKRQKLSNERKFNSYSAQNYISNNLNICEELCKNINTFLFDKEKAFKEWKSKMARTLSHIDKRYYSVPLYYFPNNPINKLLPCTECYVHALITNDTNPLNCITCEIFQMQYGILIGESILNIDSFKLYDANMPITSKIAKILINSDKFLAENVLTITSGSITTKLSKNITLYHIKYDLPKLKKIV